MKNNFLFLSLLGVLFCAVGIGRGSLASWDEAYYAVVSRGILRSGDWIHLNFFGGPFFDKPPLYFWLTAISYKLFGINEFATRLPSALAGVGAVLMTYLVGKKLLGPSAALAGAGILLSSSDFLHYARWGTLDMTHLFFFVTTILFYLESREHSNAWFGFWVSSALAVLTKGPLVVMAWILIAVDTFLTRNFGFLKTRAFWLGSLIFIVLALPWHVLAYISNPRVFVHDFLYKHYIARTFGAVEGHAGNAYFYIRTLINKCHPWIILIPAVLPWALWQSWKSAHARGIRILLAWVFLVFGFFTYAVQTKLAWYILPLHPALSLLAGALTVFILPKQVGERIVKAAIVLTLLLHVVFSKSLAHDYSPGIKQLAPAVQKLVREKTPVYLYDFHEQPAAIFYADRPAVYLDSLADFDKALENEKKLSILIPRGRYVEAEKLFSISGLREVRRTSGFRTDLALYSNA